MQCYQRCLNSSPCMEPPLHPDGCLLGEEERQAMNSGPFQPPPRKRQERIPRVQQRITQRHQQARPSQGSYPPPLPPYYQPPHYPVPPPPLQPGQFGPPPYQPPPLLPHQRLAAWFGRQSRNVKITIGCGALIAILVLCSYVASAGAFPSLSNGANQVTVTPTDTPTVQSAVNFTSTATLAPTLVPTATPTPKPAPKPTPTPKPSCNAVNGNPWCYNFVPGNLIYNPHDGFCSYFACIGNFWNGHGYVVECNDGDYSKSGGIRGG